VLPKVALASVADHCSAAQVPALLQELSSHSIRLFAGVNASMLREPAPDSPGPEVARPLLLLGLPRAQRTEVIIAGAIDQLAAAAARLWPIWFGGEATACIANRRLPVDFKALIRRLTAGGHARQQ
jgi:hypothetical protein